MERDPETITISRFKATCLAVLDRVKKTGRPIVVTRRGEPIAQVLPPPTTGRPDWIGSMAERGTLADDLIEPAIAAEAWEALSK